MKIILIGAGMMGQAIAYYIASHDDVDQIVVADRELSRAEMIAERLRDTRIAPLRLDVSAPRAVREAMDGFDVAISAVPYFFNLNLARAAVESGVSFCDLGGNNRIVAGELALDAKAREARVTVIPDCGLAPGLVNILAAAAVEDLDDVESVSIRVGGLPQHPRPPRVKGQKKGAAPPENTGMFFSIYFAMTGLHGIQCTILQSCPIKSF